MRITVAYRKNEYLASLKERMDSFFRIGAERCTGIFLGSLICVTHHCQVEWNRQITGQKNTAIGLVCNKDTGVEVRCVIMKGILAPHLFLLMFCFVAAVCLLTVLSRGAADLFPWIIPISLGITAITAGGTALAESMTEESDAGRKILISVLLDPKDPFSYLNHRNEIK